jgi:hypothetical protein
MCFRVLTHACQLAAALQQDSQGCIIRLLDVTIPQSALYAEGLYHAHTASTQLLQCKHIQDGTTTSRAVRCLS